MFVDSSERSMWYKQRSRVGQNTRFILAFFRSYLPCHSNIYSAAASLNFSRALVNDCKSQCLACDNSFFSSFIFVCFLIESKRVIHLFQQNYQHAIRQFSKCETPENVEIFVWNKMNRVCCLQKKKSTQSQIDNKDKML